MDGDPRAATQAGSRLVWSASCITDDTIPCPGAPQPGHGVLDIVGNRDMSKRRRTSRVLARKTKRNTKYDPCRSSPRLSSTSATSFPPALLASACLRGPGRGLDRGGSGVLAATPTCLTWGPCETVHIALYGVGVGGLGQISLVGWLHEQRPGRSGSRIPVARLAADAQRFPQIRCPLASTWSLVAKGLRGDQGRLSRRPRGFCSSEPQHPWWRFAVGGRTGWGTEREKPGLRGLA